MRLVPDCDVLVENYKPGRRTDRDRLRGALEINPGLIHVSMSAFGTEGP